MQDKVEIIIRNKLLSNYESFECSSELYAFADSFILYALIKDYRDIIGAPIEIKINGEIEFRGIVERVEYKYSKSDNNVRISGRSIAGLLVDFYCTEYFDISNITLKELTKRLLKDVPFINIYEIEYQKNPIGRVESKRAQSSIIQEVDIPENIVRIEPGMTVFEVLKTFAISKGLIFYCLPDGKLIFGKPKEVGEPIYNIIRTPQQSNVKSGEFIYDISRGFSEVIVNTQIQPQNKMLADKINIFEKVINKDYPFYKPLVTTKCEQCITAKKTAQLIIDKQNQDSFRLSYELRGFSQYGYNYKINEIAYVKDSVFDINDSFLITKRIFSYSKNEGSNTYIELSRRSYI